jgi:hypothetical protein
MREMAGRPLAANEAILICAGSRDPGRILAECKKRGAEVIAAFDNDITGRANAQAVARYCSENGIKHTTYLPKNGEVTITLPNDEKGRAAVANLAAEFVNAGQRFLSLPDTEADLRLVAETSDVTCTLLQILKREIGGQQPSGSDTQVPSRMETLFHRKDWNELLQGTYKNRLVGKNLAATNGRSQGDGLPAAPGVAEGGLPAYGETVPADASFDELAAKLIRIRSRWLIAKSERRSEIAKEALALVGELGGPGQTLIPLRAATRGYIEGGEPLNGFFRRANEHSAACRAIGSLAQTKECGLER